MSPLESFMDARPSVTVVLDHLDIPRSTLIWINLALIHAVIAGSVSNRLPIMDTITKYIECPEIS
jgi:hypothetical protein